VAAFFLYIAMKYIRSGIRAEAMESHLRIAAYQRQALLAQYRKAVSTQGWLRAHILLLLAEGYSRAVIAGVLFGSSRRLPAGRT
jgi:hypothetical protein